MRRDNYVLLGWQLRESASQLPFLWPADRRKRYLLKPAVEVPISADVKVWPLRSDPILTANIFVDFISSDKHPNGLDLFQMDQRGRETARSLPPSSRHIIGIATERRSAERFFSRPRVRCTRARVSQRILLARAVGSARLRTVAQSAQRSAGATIWWRDVARRPKDKLHGR